MSSLERVMCSLNGEMPDRVPLMELFVDQKVIDSIYKGMSYEDFIDYVDMDVVTCLTMASSPEDVDWVDREKGVWRDKWGALQVETGEVISVPLHPPRIDSERDLANYTVPDPSKAEVLKYAKKLVDRFKGKKAIAVVGEAVFAPSQNLRAGLENLMIDYVLNPDLALKLSKLAADYHIELYRKLIEEGVDLIVLGDDYAGKTGPFMSPEHFEKFILPGLKAVVQDIKKRGARCIKHTDGNIWKIMDMLISTGIDMLGPLEPAYMALEEVRRYAGGKVGVMGNLDVDLLSRGSVEEVKQTTRSLIKRVSPLGGHILSSGNSISASVQGKNFMAMLETAKKYGKYPIYSE
jgi:uroporphyrinogen decarboxylase